MRYDWEWQQVWLTGKVQRSWLRERWKDKIPEHTKTIRNQSKTPGSWHKLSFLLLISGCGQGAAGRMPGEGGNLFFSRNEKSHLDPHQTSSGQPLRLPFQSHTKSNSKVLLVSHCFHKLHVANDVFCCNSEGDSSKEQWKNPGVFHPFDSLCIWRQRYMCRLCAGIHEPRLWGNVLRA